MSPADPPPATPVGPGRPGLAAWASSPVPWSLTAFALYCVWLGTGPFAAGPSDWDDAAYVYVAATGDMVWELRNRYAHIWVLRLFLAPFASRQVGAIAFSIATSIGIGWTTFALARRLGGVRAGLWALALTALFPPLLRYASMPHVDLTLTLWSLLTLCCTLGALDEEATRVAARRWAVGAGLCCLLALESKETALALPALVVFLFVTESTASDRTRGWLLGHLALGVVLGTLALALLETPFASQPHFRSYNPLAYVADDPRAMPKLHLVVPKGERIPKLHREFFNQFTLPEFWALAFLGMAGLARSFRQSITARATTFWLLGSVTLTVMVSVRSWSIQVYDRYMMAPGACLIVLAAGFLASLHGRPRGMEPRLLLWWVPLVALLAYHALPALWMTQFDEPGDPQRGAVFFVLPVLLIVLFVTPWLGETRGLTHFAVASLVAISGLASVGTALERGRDARRRLAPWVELTRQLEASGSPLAILRPRNYPARRVRWRATVLSQRPPEWFALREVERADQLRADEWVLVQGERPKPPGKGYTPVVASRPETERRLQKEAFVVYRPTR